MTGDIEPYGSNTSIVQVKIGNRTYDAAYVSTCHTCTHPARMHIEEKIIQNFSYAAIERAFSGVEYEVDPGRRELMPTLSYNSIRNHFLRGHMPLEASALRRLAERRAEQIGSLYEQAESQFVDQYVLAEAVVTRAYQRMVTGDIEPEVKDGLAAAKFMQDVSDRTQQGFDTEAWSQAMQVYFETAREFMPADRWNQFTAALAKDPILRGLTQKMSGDVIDAEIIGEN